MDQDQLHPIEAAVAFFPPWCLTVWNNHQNTLRIMALSRPPLCDLIKNKLDITSRDAEHILLRHSQAATQMWTAMSSLRRMCPAFFKQAQGKLTNLADMWCGSRHKPRMGNSCLFWAPLSSPTAWLHACLYPSPSFSILKAEWIIFSLFGPQRMNIVEIMSGKMLFGSLEMFCESERSYFLLL